MNNHEILKIYSCEQTTIESIKSVSRYFTTIKNHEGFRGHQES